MFKSDLSVIEKSSSVKQIFVYLKKNNKNNESLQNKRVNNRIKTIHVTSFQ